MSYNYSFTDQLNRKIDLPFTPKRIISLVPSQTELLYDLGLRDEVVGITKFCIHPNEWFKTKTRIGGTKKLDFEKIKALQPDLIIGNKEENDQSQIEELIKHYNVWMSDIVTLKDAFDMITRVGTIVNKREEAINLKLEIEQQFNSFIDVQSSRFKVQSFTISEQQTTNNKPLTLNLKPKTIYLIWNEPIMAAGHNTFINEMLNICGFENIFTCQNSRYPETTEQQLKEKNPDIILLSSEPFPFKEKHMHRFQSICPRAKILLVDGEMFSWYGSRLKKTPAYLKKLIQSLH